MDKLIITVCTNAVNDVVKWEGNMPQTAREIATSVRESCDAGASATHVHEPLNFGQTDTMGHNIEGWLELADLIKKECNIIYGHGEGGFPYMRVELRQPKVPAKDLERKYEHYMAIEKPELIASLIHEVDHDFGNFYALAPTREEMARFAKLCLDNGVKPATESWHVGAYYNHKWLADQGLIKKPYWFTLFFGASSGIGSPCTPDELLHRIKYLPEGSLWEATVFGGTKGHANVKQALAFYSHVIAIGGHVRVGLEDYPFYWDDVPAKSNAQLVERIVRMAREIGREIATPDEARKILGIPPRKK